MADEDVAKSLDIVEKARLYENSLGLSSYNFDYYNDFDVRPIYILAAAPKLKLKRSYDDMYTLYSYDLKEIQDKRVKLEKKGYDVYVRSVEAVATGDYPITPGFVQAPVFRQSFLVLHEDFHNNSKASTSLQEAMGNVIGDFGGLELIDLLYGNSSQEYNQAKMSLWYHDQFDDLMVYYYEKLDKIYSSSLPNAIKVMEKEKILSKARYDFLGLSFTGDINNAFFSSLITYSRYHDLAEKAYKRAGSLEEITKVFKAVPSGEEKGVKYLEEYLKD